MPKAKSSRRMTKAQIAQIRARNLAPINTERVEWQQCAQEVACSCRWLDKAARLYGRRRVETALRAREWDPATGEAEAWITYWRRWRLRDRRHVMPYLVLADSTFLPDQLPFELVFAPRVAQVEAPAALAARAAA